MILAGQSLLVYDSGKDSWVSILGLVLFLSAFLFLLVFPGYRFMGKFEIREDGIIVIMNGKDYVLPMNKVSRINVMMSGTKNSGNRSYIDNGANNRIDFLYNRQWYTFKFFLKTDNDVKALARMLKRSSLNFILLQEIIP